MKTETSCEEIQEAVKALIGKVGVWNLLNVIQLECLDRSENLPAGDYADEHYWGDVASVLGEALVTMGETDVLTAGATDYERIMPFDYEIEMGAMI